VSASFLLGDGDDIEGVEDEVRDDFFISDLGRLFEVGFNIGILTFFSHRTQQIQTRYKDSYLSDLRQLRLSAISASIIEKAQIDCSLEQQIAQEWITLFLQKGFLSGYNFVHEFLEAVEWLKRAKYTPIEVCYFQCLLCNENSAGTSLKTNTALLQDLFAQLDLDSLASQPHLLKRQTGQGKEKMYHEKGEFLHADTLILFRQAQEWRILSIDLSIFSIQKLADLVDIQTVEGLRHLLARELTYLRTKSAFSDLNLDVGPVDMEFAQGLKRCFTAFKRKDKETMKLIQAASYAHSFYHFLRQHSVVPADEQLWFHVIGYTDRGMSTMTLTEEHLDWLQTCAEIYQHADPTRASLSESRQRVLGIIKQNAANSFANGYRFMDELSSVLQKGESGEVTHEEHLDMSTFRNSNDEIVVGDLPQAVQAYLPAELHRSSMTLRDAHAHLIKRALSAAEPALFVFLTGNPGIGKTSAVVEFLKAHLHEGFLFLYISPRTQVNQDVVSKLHDERSHSLDPRIFALTANAMLLREHAGGVVQYLTSTDQRRHIEQDILFVPWNDDPLRSPQSEVRLKRMTEHEIQVRNPTRSGVLKSLCSAIAVALSKPAVKGIVATAATQALKRTEKGSTLDHLSQIFKQAHSSTTGEVDFQKMREIASRIKHVFLMVDEVTGAESGAEFLHGLHTFLEECGLIGSDFGFNTKVIVADASIVEREVIERHLSTTDVEPQKIFFREVHPRLPVPPPLSLEHFRFRQQKAVAINANSYPAKALTIRYHVRLDIQRYQEGKAKTRGETTEEWSNRKLVQAIQQRLAEGEGQVIVYVQDKRRLGLLIKECEKHSPQGFKKYEDYLEIHANISDADKTQIEQRKESVRVVFMTASASRGLSFPKTRHILVEVPRFAIEQNLMEIIQVIYRGRGYFFEDGERTSLDEQPKELEFYLSEQATYYSEGESRLLSTQEAFLHLLNMLIILKTSIMTRIAGIGMIGWKRCVMIPIGGKSVSAAGTMFSERMQQLIGDLYREDRTYHNRPELKAVATYLEQLLGNADYTLLSASQPPSAHTKPIGASYLSLRTTLGKDFLAAARNGFHLLLDLCPLELGHIEGSFLVVPFAGKELQEHYLLNIAEAIWKADPELHRYMARIAMNPDYPPRVVSTMKDALKLGDHIQAGDASKMQALDQISRGRDYHYAFPLFIYQYYQQLQRYFSSDTREVASISFRDCLAGAMHTFFPVDSVLPLGTSYGEIPFVIFRSFGLSEVRKKLFKASYIFTSRELSILNIILAETPGDLSAEDMGNARF